MKEFIIIPILFIFYFYAINFVVANNVIFPTESSGRIESSGPAQVVSIGQATAVEVTRGYFFGLYRLPVYTGALGDISILHNIFFVSVILLTVFLIYRRIKLVNRNPWQRTTHF
jgi:hypothetical protein